MGVEYRVLGPLEAIVGGRSVELGAPRHRALLALLLAQANTVVPVHRLIDEIWGDAPPASAANLVQGAVSHLRKVLGKDSIVTRGHGYAVQVARMPSTFTSSSAAGGQSRARARRFRAGGGDSGGGGRSVVRLGSRRSRRRALRALGSRPPRRSPPAGHGTPVGGRARVGRHADVLGELRELVRDHPLRESCQAC